MQTAEKINLKDKFVTAYDRFADIYKSNNAFVNGQRAKAIQRFAALGLPTKRNEEYKYANVDTLLRTDFELDFNPDSKLDKATVDSLFVTGLDAHKIVLVNGVYSDELSDIVTEEGITICSLTDAFEKYPVTVEKHFTNYTTGETDGFSALNMAFAHHGVYIHVAAKTVAAKPIWVLNIGKAKNNTLLQSRNLIVVERFAQAELVSFFASIEGENTALSNTVSEIYVGHNATLKHYRIQNGNANAAQVLTSEVFVEANANYITNNITLSGGWVRNNLNISLNGATGHAELYGLYLPVGRQLVDNHTLVDHRVPNCTSNELYKGIVDDEGTAIFNGKVFVRKDAQKTNAYQSNKNILLTDTATVNTKPQLEIYADDVKCSHGSSTGSLDTDALFYLRSRGIDETNAKALLMYAFANDIINHIEIAPLREYVDSIISQRFINY